MMTLPMKPLMTNTVSLLPMRCRGVVVLALVATFAAEFAYGQDAAGDSGPLDVEQRAILREFERFEENLLKSSESTRRIDPARADLLQRARGKSIENRIAAEMLRVAGMLGGEDARFGAASERQGELIASLESVLKLLQTENERDRLEDERKRIEDLLKQTNKMIAKQRDIRADTGRSKSTDRLKNEQQKLSDDAGKLADEIDQQDQDRADQKRGDENDEPSEDSKDGEKDDGEKDDSEENNGEKNSDDKQGKPNEQDPKAGEPKEGDPQNSDPKNADPSESNPQDPKNGQPSEQTPKQGEQSPQQESDPQQQQNEEKTPGREELENARKQMQQAIEKLEKEQRDSAGEAQDEAVAELERLKAKLEEILRQLREEEEEILLALLEARFQQMMQLQLRVNAATTRLNKTPKSDRLGPFVTSATQLSRDQADILLEATKALRLLQEEGSSAAFPEAVDQMCGSMRQVVTRLEGADVGKTTQLIETMIVESLEEMIVALQKELDDKKDSEKQNQKQEQGGQQEQSLVDQLAELKMIRSLQSAVNRMTEQFDAALAEEANGDATAEDEEFLLDLARRQQRIQQITYELATKRTD